MPPADPPLPALLEFELTCDLRAIRAAGERVREFLLTQHCTEMEALDAKLALVEACNNAVQYVRPAAQQCPIPVRVACRPEEIEIEVTDYTSGFEWPAKAKLPHPEAERGRGVYLIQAVMDRCVYERSAEQNRLVLIKRRQPR